MPLDLEVERLYCPKEMDARRAASNEAEGVFSLPAGVFSSDPSTKNNFFGNELDTFPFLAQSTGPQPSPPLPRS